MNRLSNPGFAGLAVVLALGFAAPADAATKERKIVQNPTGICDALSPASDSDLRRQPTAIKNVSPTNANVVVNCSIYADEFGSDPTQVFVYFTNGSTANRTVNCTLHSGSTYYGVTTVTKSFVLEPGEMTFHYWSGFDLTSGVKSMNLSCALPKGVLMHDIGMRYFEDVGE